MGLAALVGRLRRGLGPFGSRDGKGDTERPWFIEAPGRGAPGASDPTPYKKAHGAALRQRTPTTWRRSAQGRRHANGSGPWSASGSILGLDPRAKSSGRRRHTARRSPGSSWRTRPRRRGRTCNRSRADFGDGEPGVAVAERSRIDRGRSARRGEQVAAAALRVLLVVWFPPQVETLGMSAPVTARHLLSTGLSTQSLAASSSCIWQHSEPTPQIPSRSGCVHFGLQGTGQPVVKGLETTNLDAHARGAQRFVVPREDWNAVLRVALAVEVVGKAALGGRRIIGATHLCVGGRSYWLPSRGCSGTRGFSNSGWKHETRSRRRRRRSRDRRGQSDPGPTTVSLRRASTWHRPWRLVKLCASRGRRPVVNSTILN